MSKQDIRAQHSGRDLVRAQIDVPPTPPDPNRPLPIPKTPPAPPTPHRRATTRAGRGSTSGIRAETSIYRGADAVAFTCDWASVQRVCD